MYFYIISGKKIVGINNMDEHIASIDQLSKGYTIQFHVRLELTTYICSVIVKF